MLNLYWKSGDQTRSLVEKPFKSEAELERYVLNNQELLGGDISIIHRQIRTGNKQGIPDMLGIDQNNQICMIELKNAEAAEDVLPQALQYAIWAETSPDSIKAIWLESKNRPPEVQIDWDSIDIRIILIAPSFSDAVQRMSGKIGYQVDMVQIRRYGFEEEEFVLVDYLKPRTIAKVSTTKAAGTWDWDFYESEHGKEATAQFRQAVEAVAALIKAQGWDLQYNMNKYYTGFKLGNKVIFTVAWGGTYAWKLRLKLAEDEAKGFKGEQWEFQSYDSTFKEATFRPLHPSSPDIRELEPLLVQAYKRVAGVK
jgi:hypothetical protein